MYLAINVPENKKSENPSKQAFSLDFIILLLFILVFIPVSLKTVLGPGSGYR